MENYSNKQGQSGQSSSTATMDKNQNEGNTGFKDIAGDAQKKLQEGQEKAGEFMCALNKQVRNNPWPVIAGVAVGSFLLASLINRSNK